MLIVIGAHYLLATQTRAKAQVLVDAVLLYHASHGSYPKDLQTVGYAPETVKSMIGMGGYLLEENKASFFYTSTYVPFETEDYDFSKHEWVHLD